MDWKMSNTGGNKQSSNQRGRRYSNEESKQKQAIQQAGLVRAATKQQLGHLELKPKPNKEQPKLLSSKSLSMLVPRNLFFKRCPTETRKDSEGASQKEKDGHLQSTRSFPGNFFRPTQAMASQQQSCNRMVNSTHLNIKNIPDVGCSRMEPNSLIPNAATSNSILTVNSTISSVTLPHLSPIVCRAAPGDVVDMSWSETASSTNYSTGSEKRAVNRIKTLAKQHKPETVVENPTVRPETDKNNKRSVPGFRHFKSTGLVLRDVKNSLGLRIKARQESKAFAKLINETSTTATPTKLYSPFDIYTDTSAMETPVGSQRQKTVGSQSAALRRKLNMRNSTKPFGVSKGGENESMGDSQPPPVDFNTPKARIVQQHRRHLMQVTNNKFTFDSPAGRHCETVKDLEWFQQCIEDISKAIQTRAHSRTGSGATSNSQ